MPPRYAYWTILVDEQPTAFRAADRADLQPTFKRLQQKHPSVRMVWFQNGKIWNSRLDAQEAMRARGQRGRAGDFRQRPRTAPGEAEGRGSAEREGGKLEWKPKGTFDPAEGRSRRSPEREGGKLEWKPRSRGTSTGTGTRTGTGTGTGTPTSPQAPRSPRPKTWRPGGDHKDPRQKYKDARKAKWTRFKQSIRKRWESKQGNRKKRNEPE